MARAIDAMEFPAKKNKIKTSTGEKIFTVFNYAFFTLLCLLMLYPFWHVLMQSLSSMEEAQGRRVPVPQGLRPGHLCIRV